MSVFSATIRHHSFYWQISMLCFVLGIVLAAAMYTSNRIARLGVSSSRTGFDYTYFSQPANEKILNDNIEIKKLREDNNRLSEIIAKHNDGLGALNTQLRETQTYAGLTEVTGPGIVVTLQDSKKQSGLPFAMPAENYLIHDRDINEVINELRSAGAEAIAVGQQRVVNSTAVRCVGPVAMVNDVKEGAPFVIRAIGDPETLMSAMNISNGVLDSIRRFDPMMARSEKALSLRLPAFSGNTQPKYMRAVKPPKTTANAR
ncbi:MAG TPA: DUF881 domain-containing protein [Chthonomonadaceae bacterium]|nr:DUF881 domain-containing protein [Chthonomonadaceae bacterium]